MDERLGRRAARELGLRATGLLGCLLRAKDARLLDAISPVISELQGMRPPEHVLTWGGVGSDPEA